MYTADLYRLRGELALERDPTATEEAAGDLDHALALAGSQKAKLFELRAAMSLHKLGMARGRGDETRRRLAAVYDWFGEGMTLPDLRAARAQLEAPVLR